MEVLFFALPLDHAHKDLHKDSTVLRGTGILAQELSFSRRCRHARNRILAQELSYSRRCRPARNRDPRSEALLLADGAVT